jgi:hypothetical protein
MASSEQDDVATIIPVSCDGVKTHVFMDDSIELCGAVYHRSAKASRREDLEVEEPITCGDCSSFHFDTTLAGMLGPTLIGDQVVQMCQPRQKRLLAPFGMMEPLHHKQLPVDRVMRLIQQRTAHGHLRVSEHRIPARLLVLEPAPDAFPICSPSSGSDMVDEAAEPLAHGKHPQTLPLACSVKEGVELGAQGLTDRRRDRHEFLRELEERVAQAGAHAYTREQHPQTLSGAIETIRQDAPDAIRGLPLDCSALEHAVGLGQRGGTGLRCVAEMPDPSFRTEALILVNFYR